VKAIHRGTHANTYNHVHILHSLCLDVYNKCNSCKYIRTRVYMGIYNPCNAFVRTEYTVLLHAWQRARGWWRSSSAGGLMDVRKRPPSLFPANGLGRCECRQHPAAGAAAAAADVTFDPTPNAWCSKYDFVYNQKFPVCTFSNRSKSIAFPKALRPRLQYNAANRWIVPAIALFSGPLVQDVYHIQCAITLYIVVQWKVSQTVYVIYIFFLIVS